MNVIIENIPIFARIAEGIKDHILMGDIKEGDQLPSTTQISNEYDINIATVNKGINVLVSEGVVFKKRGIGMFVAEGAVKKLKAERRKSFKETFLRTFLDEADRIGYTNEELQKMVVDMIEERDKEKAAKENAQG
ncbi:MAG: GntR family transcriptional regulator [Ruminococcus sp.]|nr:GntR family transcriptional regulator [Ruminococcus sp.]